MLHLNNEQNKTQAQSSADRIITLLSPVHQREKKKKNPHLVSPELKHKTHPTQNLHKPLEHVYESRNQKEQRIQPQSLEKGGLKCTKFRKKGEKAEIYCRNEGTT